MVTQISEIGRSRRLENRASAGRATSITAEPIGDEPGETDDQVKTCPGLGGAKVLVNAFEARLRIGFAWEKGAHARTPVWVVEAWSAGLVIDWRGAKASKGFVPYGRVARIAICPECTLRVTLLMPRVRTRLDRA